MKYIVSILFSILLSIILPTTLLRNENVETSITLIPPPPTPIEQILLDDMTIEEKVGQLFLFGIDGTTLSAEDKQFLQDSNTGGILLYAKNIVDEEQLRLLIQEIQNNSKTQRFIAIDQEGGVVARLKWNDTLTIAQGDIASPEQAYNIAKERGEILRGLGINMNLAPVVEYITDQNSFMYNRVYRGTQEEVAQKGISSVQGYQASDIVSVLKHFPGHSDASPDSHYALPVVNISNDQWNEYIKPFSRIVEQTSVDGIMVGHIEFPNIDSVPATLSSEILTNRLINTLEYEGLIISDDMEMDALNDIDTDLNIAKRALEAGNDILIYSKYNVFPTKQKDIYDFIVQEVKAGEMDIDKKVLKILMMKLKYNIVERQ